MKNITSILRTLCLTALLCIASVSASAYKVYERAMGDNLTIDQNTMGNDKILVIKGGPLPLPVPFSLYISPGYAVIIEPGVAVGSFKNEGDLYVFGTLEFWLFEGVPENRSNIYTDGKNRIPKNMPGNIYTSIPYSSHKVAGNFPITATSGWNNCWQKGITCGDDFYPTTKDIFEDEDLTNPIADLEEWKTAHSNIDLGLKIGGTACDWEYYDTDEKKGFYYSDLTLEGYEDIEAKADFNVIGTFTYTRDMSSVIGKWQSWYEPFEVELTTEVLAMIDAAQIAGILTDADGNTVVAFKKMGESETMKANTPYVIRMKDSSGSLMLEYENKTIYKPVENKYQFSSMFDDFEIGGIYTARNNSDWYVLSTTGAFSRLNTTKLQAQRLWLTITPRTDSPYYDGTASSKAFIDLMVLGDDEATGIESLTPTLSKGEGAIYNLSGQRVTSIQKGQIYIMNGKKYVAK